MRKSLTSLFSILLLSFALLFFTVSPAQAQNTCQQNDPTSATCCAQTLYYNANKGACDRIGEKLGRLPVEISNNIGALAAAAGSAESCPATTSVKNINADYFVSVVALGNILGNSALRMAGGGCTGGANPQAFIGHPPKGQDIAFYQSGVMDTLATTTGYVAMIPVSSSDYIADLGESFSHPFAQPAYAQGLGFSSLRPVLGLWKIFRNVAYFFFVIVFLFIGFMIMFRSKIGGQAAVTVQQALPKIVVALLLVTFSYAIAGLMIDIMYLIIYLMIGIFSGGSLTTSSLTSIAFSDSIFSNIAHLMGDKTTGVVGSISGQIGTAVTGMLSDIGWAESIAGIVGFGANIVFFLVMIVALLVNMFRIFFALLQAYVMVLFSVVFAPIQLLLGALPGQNTFGAWLKGLWENLLVFPVVIFFLFCAQYFSNGPDAFGTNSNGFAAPQLGLQAGASGAFVLAILQFGILALIPKAVEIAKGLASGKLNIDAGKAMGEFYKQGKLGQKLALGAIPAVAGAGLGYRYATDRANKLGLEGNAKRLAQLGGLVGGGGVGLNAIGAARKLAPEALRQLGQAEMQRVAEETKGAANKRQAEAATSRSQAIAQGTKDDIDKSAKGIPSQTTQTTRPSNRYKGL